MNGDPPSGSGAPRPAGEPGEGSGPARPRRPGSEPLALGVTALFVGLLATVASAINSRTSGRAYVPQAMWIALVAIGALAGAGAVLAWLTGPQRLRPSPVIGAVIGAVALIGGPLEAVAVRPHAVRARVVAVDPATGRLVWTARPPLTNLSAPVAVAPDGTLVVAGQATASTCDGRSAQVHLDAATGSQRGATTFGAFRPTGLSIATSTDGTTTYEYTAGGAGAVVRATRGGTTLWAHPAGGRRPYPWARGWCSSTQAPPARMERLLHRSSSRPRRRWRRPATSSSSSAWTWSTRPQDRPCGPTPPAQWVPRPGAPCGR